MGAMQRTTASGLPVQANVSPWALPVLTTEQQGCTHMDSDITRVHFRH